MTVNQIREELMQVRYYYANKELLDQSMQITGNAEFLEMIKKYNSSILAAEPKLYAVYVYLYLENYTQVALANKWGFAPEYIQRLHSRLLNFFHKQFNC